MSYTPTEWIDRIVERPRTYQVQNNPDGTVTLTPKPGTVIQEGTPVNATNLNNIEQGLSAHLEDYTLQVPYGGTTTNSGNAYSIATPAIVALTAGMAISVKINADSTGASTLNWNGKGAKPIKKANGTDVTNLKANGIYTLRYDGTNFILQGEGASGNATASDLLSGKTASTDAGDIVGTLDEIPTKSISSGSAVPLFLASPTAVEHRGCIGEDRYVYIPDSTYYINQLSLPDMTRIARLSYTSNRTIPFIGVAANGNIYYTLGNPNATIVFGRKIDGTAVPGISGLPSVATTAKEIAVNGNYVYVIWGSKLIKLDATTGDYIQVEVPYNLYQGIVVNGEGDLYLGGENRLTKVKGDDLSIVWDSIKTNEFKSTNDLAIDLNGNLYFWHTDSYSRKRFSKYDPSGDLVFNVIDDAASAALIGRDYLYTIASSTYNLQARDFSDYSVVYEIEDSRLTSASSVIGMCRQNRDFDNLILKFTNNLPTVNFINYLKIIVD